ncbi:DMT family transporter [Clostridium sp. CS001]|uniref:DMT family transporter n=1 Tax=Clostridium sp. CS001 TaxID=2880648 RepID=UPI001CF4BAEF|nr:DMT family transporter [Clostridium sp. CS001]MCB2288168.1 DMT family transporter [Clostridium sp. CS001]
MNNENNTLAYLAAIVSSILFGLSFLFSKIALAVASPLALVAFRFLLAFFIMSALIVFKIFKVNYKNKPIKELILLCLAEPVVYFIFETYGIREASSSIAGLMLSIIPIAVTILGVYFLKEIPTIKRIMFIVISVSGVAIIGVMSASNNSDTSIRGIILLLGAVTCAGLFTIISRKSSKYFTPIEITYFMMGSGALFFNIIWISNLIIKNEITTYFEPLKSSEFLISVLYLGILSSVAAYLLINYTLSKIDASNTSVFANISTIVSVVAGVVILKEAFHFYDFIGSALILIGVWGTNRFK